MGYVLSLEKLIMEKHSGVFARILRNKTGHAF